FFCLSNPKPHKNIPMLLESYRLAQAQEQAIWPIVLNFKPARGNASPKVQSIEALSEKDMHALLHGAGAVLFPSLYEGFGLPPVEAAACGVPTIVSDIPSHREG